jgi:hypothetical protein
VSAAAVSVTYWRVYTHDIWLPRLVDGRPHGTATFEGGMLGDRWKIETFDGKKSPLFRENQRDNERKWLAKVQELEWYKLIQKPKDNMQL